MRTKQVNTIKGLWTTPGTHLKLMNVSRPLWSSRWSAVDHSLTSGCILTNFGDMKLNGWNLGEVRSGPEGSGQWGWCNHVQRIWASRFTEAVLIWFVYPTFIMGTWESTQLPVSLLCRQRKRTLQYFPGNVLKALPKLRYGFSDTFLNKFDYLKWTLCGKEPDFGLSWSSPFVYKRWWG